MRRSGEGGCAHSRLGPDSQRAEKGASLRLDHNLSHSILLEALVNQSFKEKRGRGQRSFSALDPKGEESFVVGDDHLSLLHQGTAVSCRFCCACGYFGVGVTEPRRCFTSTLLCRQTDLGNNEHTSQ